MVKFEHKKINTITTLGERLRQHRENLGLSLEKVARRLQINSRYLRYLENDDYDQLPAEIYTKNFIKKYCQLLDVNDSAAVELFNREKNVYQKIKKTPPHKTSKKHFIERVSSFILQPNFIKYFLLIVIVISIVVYISYGVNRIFSPPELIIKNPSAGNIIVTTSNILIEGVTEKEVELLINNKQVLYDEDGRFSVNLDLQKGLNIIKISSSKKHSKPNIVYKQVVVDNIIESNP